MDFLKHLQSSDEATKNRWIVIITVIIMVIIVYIWLFYFNNLLAGFSTPGQNLAADGGAGAAGAGGAADVGGATIQVWGGPSFWQTMANAPAFIYQFLSDKIRALGNILQAPREYIIKPPQ